MPPAPHADPHPVVTRFAPSPTGHLHIGGARTALFCWAFARARGGRFLLRIEDTDQKRSSEAASRGILEDLAWLGIDWDEGPAFEAGGRTLGGDARGVGPFFQSDRRAIYDTYIDRLLATGHAYPAFDSAEDLAAMRKAAEADKRTFVYRRAPGDDHARALERMRAGEPCVIRFRMPEGPVRFTDEVLGGVEVPYTELDDFVIRKADGFPTYHFAVVVDDELMGVTHVMRGQEHLNNTPRHVALMGALTHADGTVFRVPKFAHLTVIANQDNSKMSKRDRDKAARARSKEVGVATLGDAEQRAAGRATAELRSLPAGAFEQWFGDKTRQLPHGALEELAAIVGVELPEIAVDDFRRSGYLPEAVLNYIALLGWNPGEKNADGTDRERFDTGYLVEKFSFERLGKSASKFDRAKLLAFNQEAIAGLSDAAFVDRWAAWAARDDRATLETLGVDRMRLVAGAVKPRCRTLRDAAGVVAFALMPDDAVAFDDKAVEKVLRKNDGEGIAALRELAGVLSGVHPFEPAAIEAALADFAESKGLGMGKVAQPLRVAVTGGTVSPPMGETLAVLGAESVQRRIARCIEQCG
jgi:glutamyl-tRNA synthetase